MLWWVWGGLCQPASTLASSQDDLLFTLGYFLLRILLSNDDGHLAPGIHALYEQLSSFAKVTVIAPEVNCSGASSSLTLNRPLSVQRAVNGFYLVNGTPADCVHLALTGYLEETPDLVVSGINNGANLADDVIYSGTVAAALEGHLLHAPGIAFSLVEQGWHELDSAARIASEMVQQFVSHQPLPKGWINVNIPNRRYEDIKGIWVTRLGTRTPSKAAHRSTSPKGEKLYWVGPAGDPLDATPGTDLWAVKQGAVAVTPLKIDYTATEQMLDCSRWFSAKLV